MGLGARLALRLEPFERRSRSCRARLNLARRTVSRRLAPAARGPRIACQLLLEGGQPLGDRGFDLDEFFARPERFLAGAGADLRAVDGDLSKADQPFGDQRRHALRQQPIEDLRLPDPEISEPVIIQRHAARQPPIGGVALGEPFQFARRTHPFNRRIEPQRKQNRGIGGRPARFALARENLRENLIVKLRKIEALDETPDDARAMLRRQKPLEIDPIPAQLTPVRPHHPSFRHRRFTPHLSDERITAQAKAPIPSHARKRERQRHRSLRRWVPQAIFVASHAASLISLSPSLRMIALSPGRPGGDHSENGVDAVRSGGFPCPSF